MSEEIDEVSASLGSLNDVLWTLRETLGLIEYGLLVQRLVAEAGETRHLSTAADQLDSACGRLRRVEIERAASVDLVAGVLVLPDDVSLAQVAEAAPEPWASILTDHVDALRELSASVTTRRVAAERVLRAGADAVGNALRSLTDPTVGDSLTQLDPALSGLRLDRRA